MAITSNKEYKDNRMKYAYPSSDINPELKKNKDFFRAYAEAMWSEYISNQCEWPCYFDEENSHSDRLTIDRLRSYAKGRQSIDPIKDTLCRRDPQNPGKHLTRMNIRWKGYMIMPEIFDMIRSFNSKIDYEISATAIDDDSVDIKDTDRQYMKYFLHRDVQKFMEITGWKPNMKVDPQQVGARTESDVDLLMDSGGFNLENEIAAQVVCNKTKKESYFAPHQDKWFDDLTTIGRAAGRTKINKTKSTAEIMWMDPKYCIVPRSKFPDFHDKTRWGYIREMTIGDFRDETDLTETQLMQLAQDYSSMNPSYTELTYAGGYYDPTQARSDYMSQYGIDPLNDVRILILDGQFLSLNINKYINFTRESTGVSSTKKVSYEYEISEKDAKAGNTLEKDQSLIKYEFKWIIGSDYFINYGQSEYVRYAGEKGNRVPVLDGHFTQTNNSSIVERCTELVDDLNTALFKLRNAINSLPPGPRMIIEQELLNNVKFNNKVQSTDDLLRVLAEKGVLVVSKLDPFGKNISPSGKTIEFIPSGLLEDITIFNQEMTGKINAIERVTGTQGIQAAMQPADRQGAAVSKMAEVLTSNALFPTFNAFKYLFEPMFDDIVGKWQLIVDDNEQNIAHVPLGANTMQVFKIGKQFAKTRFNLRLDMVIGEEEKRMMLAEITNLKAARRQNGGKGGITGAQYLKIYDLIMSGNRKLAQFVLAQIERLQEERESAINAANQEKTFTSQQRVAHMAEKGKQNTYQVEGGVKSNTMLLTELAKRKTKMLDLLLTLPQEGQIVDKEFIQQQIDLCDKESASLLQMIHQESQAAQQDNSLMPAPQPAQQPDQGQGGQQQQLQQAS